MNTSNVNSYSSIQTQGSLLNTRQSEYTLTCIPIQIIYFLNFLCHRSGSSNRNTYKQQEEEEDKFDYLNVSKGRK